MTSGLMASRMLAAVGFLAAIAAYLSAVFWTREAAIVIIVLATIDVLAAMYVAWKGRPGDKTPRVFQRRMAVDVALVLAGLLAILIFHNWVGLVPYLWVTIDIFTHEVYRHQRAVKEGA